MKLLQLVVLAAVALSAEAFTTKKREPTRPAFKTAVNAAVAATVEHEVQREDQPVFAFKGQAMVPVQVEVIDDEIEIGYTTGLLACVVSLALGFSLGYGTL